MSKSGRNAPPQPSSRHDETPPLLETLLIAAVSMLLVWRLLSPTEGASLGYGVWMAQFSLAALVLWSICFCRRKTPTFQFHKIDVAVALFVAGHLISGFLALTGDADQRATINMLAEWAGLGATYFLMRQTFTTWDIRRQITVIMLAATTALAGYGLWQHYVWYPQTAAQYEQIRKQLDELQQPSAAGSNAAAGVKLRRQLIEMGVPPTALERQGRMSYEARLLSSTEPLGRFALTNTFAGLLAVWLIVLTAVMAQRLVSSPAGSVPLNAWICPAGIALLITWCLLLTKSRTAYAGTLAGGLAILVSLIASRTALPRHTWRVVIAVVVVVAGLVTATAISGGLDRWVVTQAQKSLQYRWEYWTGTWDVIRAQPVLGIGPGNFRNHYLQFKRPESSEEISDPHNAVLDAWVNGGLLAVAGFAAMGVLCVVSVWRQRRAKPAVNPNPVLTTPPRERESPHGRPAGQIMLPIPQASTCGAFIAFFMVGLTDFSPATWGLLIAWSVSLPLAGRALGAQGLRPDMFLMGLITLFVHLLGAGGIGMPAICQTLLLLVAMVVPIADVTLPLRQPARSGGIAAVLLSLGLSVACWHFATGPVTRRESHIAEGDYQLWERGNPGRAEQSYRSAAASDPYSGESWQKLAAVEFGLWWSAPRDNAESLRKATEMLRKSLEKNPRSWTDYRTLGEYYLQAFSRSPVPELAADAVAAFSRAVELYPNSAEVRGRLAEALSRGGHSDAARREAVLALQLNETTQQAGHVDRVLPEKTLELLRKLANPADSPPPRGGAD